MSRSLAQQERKSFTREEVQRLREARYPRGILDTEDNGRLYIHFDEIYERRESRYVKLSADEAWRELKPILSTKKKTALNGEKREL